jgi:tetratricopeptide (TPR) repeat protein
MDVLTAERGVDNATARVEFQLGREAFQDDNLESAACHFQAALDADPNHLNARLNLGRTFVKMNDDDRAEPIFRGIIEDSPRNEAAQAMLGRLLVRRDDRVGALGHLEIAAAERPNDEDLPLLIARLLSELSRPEDAAAVYRAVLERNPENTKARRFLALLEWTLGNRVASLALLQQAADAEPGDHKLRLVLASRLLQLGRLADAAVAFRLVADGEPENVEPLVGLGECALLAFDTDTAATYFRSAAALAPDNASVRKWISKVEEIQLRGIGSTSSGHRPGYDTWRKNLIEAAEIMRAPEVDAGKRGEAAPLLLSYGYTESVPSSFGAFGMAARELERMGLSRPDATLESADPQRDELNSLTGCVERLNIGADTLLLVFGGSSHNAFLSFDALHRFLGVTGASIVYLRNVSFNTYSSIAGLAGDFAGTVEKLREIKVRAGAKRILILGYCVGVIGAVNYGIALEAEAIIGFRPFLSIPKLEDMPPALAARAAELMAANPLYQPYPDEADFNAEGTPHLTLIVNADIEPAASICNDIARRSSNVTLTTIKGGANSDSLLDATARGLLWPLLTSFIDTGKAATDMLRALECGC